jgi:hypothetical protein
MYLVGVIMAMLALGGFGVASSRDLAASSYVAAGLTLSLLAVLLLVGMRIRRTRRIHARARHARRSASTTSTGATVRI